MANHRNGCHLSGRRAFYLWQAFSGLPRRAFHAGGWLFVPSSVKLHEQVDFMGDTGNKIGVGRRVEQPFEMIRQDTVISPNS